MYKMILSFSRRHHFALRWLAAKPMSTELLEPVDKRRLQNVAGAFAQIRIIIRAVGLQSYLKAVYSCLQKKSMVKQQNLRPVSIT